MEAFEQDVTIDVKSSWSKEGLVSDYHAYWNVVKLYLCYYAPVKMGTYIIHCSVFYSTYSNVTQVR